MAADTLALRLTPRDIELARDLFLNRVMMRDQILKLGHFQSVSRLNRRLKKLVDVGIVRRLTAWHRPQMLYTAGPNAASLLAPLVDGEEDDLRRQCLRNVPPMFLEHTLRLVDLRSQVLAETTKQGVIFTWVPELLCRHEYSVRNQPNGQWHREILKPDAFIRLERESQVVNAFVELDMGTMSVERFEAKIKRYTAYHCLGLFQEVYGYDRFSVLTVTTGKRRLGHLAALAKSVSQPAFLFTTFAELDERGFLGTGWLAPDSKSRTALSWEV